MDIEQAVLASIQRGHETARAIAGDVGCSATYAGDTLRRLGARRIVQSKNRRWRLGPEWRPQEPARVEIDLPEPDESVVTAHLAQMHVSQGDGAELSRLWGGA